MISLPMILLSLALSIDASIVAFALGLLHERDALRNKVKNGFLTALTFGFFQFFMLWIGGHAGFMLTFSGIGHYFQFVIGFIFFILGIKCVHESLETKEKKIEWAFFPVILLGIATSVDALASGVSLGTIPEAYKASLVVGVITFLMCSLFYFLGQFFKKVPDKWLLRLAGLIFVILGGQVFWSIKHLL